jgi:hypothetical protein
MLVVSLGGSRAAIFMVRVYQPGKKYQEPTNNENQD